MPSLTYGMLKSLCKVTFNMYQGALASFLNVFNAEWIREEIDQLQQQAAYWQDSLSSAPCTAQLLS
jgi:hypothetical protein